MHQAPTNRSSFVGWRAEGPASPSQTPPSPAMRHSELRSGEESRQRFGRQMLPGVSPTIPEALLGLIRCPIQACRWLEWGRCLLVLRAPTVAFRLSSQPNEVSGGRVPHISLLRCGFLRLTARDQRTIRYAAKPRSISCSTASSSISSTRSHTDSPASVMVSNAVPACIIAKRSAFSGCGCWISFR